MAEVIDISVKQPEGYSAEDERRKKDYFDRVQEVNTTGYLNEEHREVRALWDDPDYDGSPDYSPEDATRWVIRETDRLDPAGELRLDEASGTWVVTAFSSMIMGSNGIAARAENSAVPLGRGTRLNLDEASDLLLREIGARYVGGIDGKFGGIDGIEPPRGMMSWQDETIGRLAIQG